MDVVGLSGGLHVSGSRRDRVFIKSFDRSVMKTRGAYPRLVMVTDLEFKFFGVIAISLVLDRQLLIIEYFFEATLHHGLACELSHPKIRVVKKELLTVAIWHGTCQHCMARGVDHHCLAARRVGQFRNHVLIRYLALRITGVKHRRCTDAFLHIT